MTYFKDVYKKRGSWWGATSKEQYQNAAIKYFEDYLLNSPNADTVIIDNIETAAAIHTNKEDESKISKYFLIGLDTSIGIGDLIYWSDTYWVVTQREKRSFEAYTKVLAFKCNFNLKWVDEYGVINESPCYLFGTMQSSVQDNFKISNGIMSPSANEFLEVILPYKVIREKQRFIIRDRAWKILGRDLISVDGLLYMYLQEDLRDAFDDNTTLSLADYDTVGNSYIDLGITALNLAIGASFKFNPVLYKDNKVVEAATFTYSSLGAGHYFTLTSNQLTGLALGSSTLIVSSIEQPDLQATCTINVLLSAPATDVLQLVGDDTLKWGRTRTYTSFYHTGGTPSEIAATFTLLNNTDNLVSFVSQDTTSCSIIANTSGLSGKITLRATTAHGTIDKEIAVVSVW